LLCYIISMIVECDIFVVLLDLRIFVPVEIFVVLLSRYMYMI